MNRGTIRDEIRRLILDTDTTNPRWSDTVLNDRIDISHDRIAALTNCINSQELINFVDGTSEYALSDYFLTEQRVSIKAENATIWTAIGKVTEAELSLMDAEWFDDEGTPEKYYLRGHYIGFYPCPSYSLASAARIDETIRPTAFSADADIPFNSVPSLYAYHLILAYDVARMCSMDEGNANKIPIFYNEVEKMLRQIKYELSNESESTRMINIYESARTQPRRTR